MAFIQKARRAYKKSGLKKTYRKVRTMAKKRYSNRSNIVKDVQMLKHLVNIEKKRSDVSVKILQPFGQRLNGANDGGYHAIISPTILQGVSQGERTGNSIKLVSGCLDVQISQQANTLNNLKLKLWIICRPDNAAGYSAATTYQQFFEVNPFSERRDYYAPRDPEFFSEFRVIKSLTMTLAQDQISGGMVYIQKKIPLRLNHHQKFNTDGSTNPTKNQFYLIVTCSDGDAGTPSGQPAQLNAAQIQYNMRWYYTDN